MRPLTLIVAALTYLAAGCGEAPQNSADSQKPENQMKGSMQVPEGQTYTNDGAENKPIAPK